MSTSKRAWLYVKYCKRRTMLLFLLFMVLMSISLLGFTFRTASSDAIKELRSSIGGYFTIHTGADGVEKTDEALMEQVKSLDNVRECNGVDTYYMYTEGLDLIPASWHGTGMVGEFMPKFIGCTNSDLHERFISSSFMLVEGRPIQPNDHGAAVISAEVAGLNGLAVGDKIIASVIPGVRDWLDDAAGTQAEFEIVGIYATTRSEAVGPMTPECDLQENIIFTDINTAKELYCIKFPNCTEEEYVYSSGIMLFLIDPAKMTETVEQLKQQDYANWDGILIYENSTAYQQAAAPIQKAATISLLLLVIILAISICILSLTLLMWTRERMKEIGILISIGISAKGICEQILLENYLVAIPAFIVSLLLSAILSRQIGGLFGDMLMNVHLTVLQAVIVLVCSLAVILITVILTSIFIMRKKPKEILTDLS